jgi:hypothetical protein
MKKNFYKVSRVFSLAFITTVLTMASGANAGTWTLNDNLGSNTIANWSCWASPYVYDHNDCWNYQGTHVFNDTTSLTDSYYVSLYNGTGWSDVGRPVTLGGWHPPYSFLPTIWCKAQMTILPAISSYGVTAQLEVIDSASWTYVTTKRVQYSTQPPIPKYIIATPSWVPSAKDVFVRLGIIGTGKSSHLYVDDMKVSCTQ